MCAAGEAPPVTTLRTIDAHHEAGHAVVARLYGAIVNRFEMKRDDSKHPRVRVNLGICLPPDSARSRLACAAMYLAGPAAENLYQQNRNEWLPDREKGWTQDLDSALAILRNKETTNEEVIILMQRAAEKADKLVKAHWGTIEQIAALLMEHDDLDGAKVKEIVQPLNMRLACSYATKSRAACSDGVCRKRQQSA